MSSINPSKLTRDFTLYPLGEKEQIPKSDLCYLYLELNWSDAKISHYFGLNEYQVRYQLSKHEIKKSEEMIKLSRVDTLLEKYGVMNSFQSEECKTKIRQTMQKKYGVDTYCQSTVYDKEKEMFKRTQTNLKKYGVTHPMKLDEFKERQRKTVQNKYGVSNIIASKEIQDKRHLHIDAIVKKSNISKLANDTYIHSQEEDYIYAKLCERYRSVKRQYISEEYPFACDFYIPEIKLYIEYQGYEGHGKEPFDKNNSEHQKLVQKWKEKSTNKKNSVYLQFIKTFTKSDVLKRETAKKNKLNFLEFFTIVEFNNWYEKKGENICQS